MKATKYRKIISQKQYDQYCKELVSLVFGSAGIDELRDEIKLLNSLVEEWEKEHSDILA